ncbi:hypothetical protein [Streptomyces sp. NPDC001815]|uniref:hypothetical protein n=1 Tax=Streptomyces sp. NPDC001815 TaxID=3154526 RepID=UPI0033308CDC
MSWHRNWKDDALVLMVNEFAADVLQAARGWWESLDSDQREAAHAPLRPSSWLTRPAGVDAMVSSPASSPHRHRSAGRVSGSRGSTGLSSHAQSLPTSHKLRLRRLTASWKAVGGRVR